MINANELRLGNWVFDTEGKPNQVNMDALRYLISYGNTPICQVHPIPLTEEVLLKCGFIGSVKSKKLPTESLYSYMYLDHWQIRARGGSDFSIPKCEYLHQLQNLYFALTGQELTYTP